MRPPRGGAAPQPGQPGEPNSHHNTDAENVSTKSSGDHLGALPTVARPRVGALPRFSDQQRNDATDATAVRLPVVSGTEFAPVGRARYPLILVEHDVCGYSHAHRKFEVGLMSIVRSPQCAPHTSYVVEITAMVPPIDTACRCADCAVDTTPGDLTGSSGAWEWYSVHEHLWAAATSARPADFLCVACLELRLGRQLTADDFTPYPINDLDDQNHAWGWRTDRLLDRMTAPGGGA